MSIADPIAPGTRAKITGRLLKDSTYQKTKWVSRSHVCPVDVIVLGTSVRYSGTFSDYGDGKYMDNIEEVHSVYMVQVLNGNRYAMPTPVLPEHIVLDKENINDQGK